MKRAIMIFPIAMILFLTFCKKLHAQEPSAILDMESTSQGALLPRMTSAERLAIANPANSLTVYDLDTKSYWFYRLNEWVNLKENPKTFGGARTICPYLSLLQERLPVQLT